MKYYIIGGLILDAFQKPQEKFKYVLDLLDKVDIAIAEQPEHQAELLGPFN